jgi:hypothetical protein
LIIALCTAHSGSQRLDNHLKILDFSKKWTPTCKTHVTSNFTPKTKNMPTVRRNILIPTLSKMTPKMLRENST